MEAETTLIFRLESYLLQLSDVNRRWIAWLAGSEQAAIRMDSSQLARMQESAHSLFAELQQVLADRQQILLDAQQSGWSCPDLTSLAVKLSTGNKPGLLRSLSTAQHQLSNLRRLHVATWVLLNQAWQHCTDSLQLMMVGSRPHVYQPHGERRGNISDNEGGRLLDASL